MAAATQPSELPGVGSRSEISHESAHSTIDAPSLPGIPAKPVWSLHRPLPSQSDVFSSEVSKARSSNNDIHASIAKSHSHYTTNTLQYDRITGTLKRPRSLEGVTRPETRQRHPIPGPPRYSNHNHIPGHANGRRPSARSALERAFARKLRLQENNLTSYDVLDQRRDQLPSSPAKKARYDERDRSFVRYTERRKRVFSTPPQSPDPTYHHRPLRNASTTDKIQQNTSSSASYDLLMPYVTPRPRTLPVQSYPTPPSLDRPILHPPQTPPPLHDDQHDLGPLETIAFQESTCYLESSQPPKSLHVGRKIYSINNTSTQVSIPFHSILPKMPLSEQAQSQDRNLSQPQSIVNRTSSTLQHSGPDAEALPISYSPSDLTLNSLTIQHSYPSKAAELSSGDLAPDIDNSHPLLGSLSIPQSLDCSSLPDNPAQSIELLFANKASMACFLMVAVEYKRKGLLYAAEAVGMASIQLWQNSSDPSVIAPMLLFLTMLCTQMAKTYANTLKGDQILAIASAHLLRFQNLDSHRGDLSQVFSNVPFHELIHPNLAPSNRTETSPGLSDQDAVSTRALNRDKLTDLKGILNNTKMQLVSERRAKRVAEDSLRIEKMSRRQLEDELYAKDCAIRQIEYEMLGRHLHC